MRTAATPLATGILEDAGTLAWLHDAELTAASVKTLKLLSFPANLSLLPLREDTRAAWSLMAAAVAELPGHPDGRTLDDLAADYAEIYLTGALGASPYESVWTDDDGLICQDAMFEMRTLYAELGLASASWRQRPDDHLVLQLLYLGEAAAVAREPDDWRKLGRALDQHLLQWLPAFAGRIAQRGGSAFYVALAALTCAWLETLRDLIAERLEEPRPDLASVRSKPAAPATVIPLHFVPGTGPSW